MANGEEQESVGAALIARRWAKAGAREKQAEAMRRYWAQFGRKQKLKRLKTLHDARRAKINGKETRNHGKRRTED